MKAGDDTPDGKVEKRAPSKEWLRLQTQVLDAVGQAVVVTKPDGTVIFWNKFAERLYGCSASEALRRKVCDLVSVEMSQEQLHEMENRIRAGESWTGEFSVRRRDGSIFPAVGSNSPVYGEQGDLIAIVGLAKDITERKDADEQLRRKEIQLSTAQQLAHFGSWEWDIVTNKITWSDELYRIFGLQPQEFSPTYDDVQAWTHPEDQIRIRQIHTQAMQKGGRVSYERRITRPDGAVRILYTIGEVVTDESGKPVRMYGATQDVTEAKQAEAALRESEERFREMADNIEDVFWIRDLHSPHFYYVSPAYEKIWGRSRESLCASPASWKDAIHPEDRSASEEVHAHDPERHDDVYRIIRPDGSIRWIRDRAFPVRDVSGNIARLARVSTDITEAKEAQLELQKTTEQLQHLSQQLIEVQEIERRHLARELHDEIGQVLTATKIIIQSVQQSPEDGAVAARLQESVASIDSLLQQVRRISLDLRPPLLDDLGLLPALRCHLDQLAKRSGLDVRFAAPETWCRLDPKIETSCFRIVQEALTNVVRHARAKRVSVELDRHERLHVEVRDDGTGFDIEKALQRARQGETVGLLGMQERASLLGGSVVIQSAPGKGTELRAFFPLTTGKP